jgi:hypothetical protein
MITINIVESTLIAMPKVDIGVPNTEMHGWNNTRLLPIFGVYKR